MRTSGRRGFLIARGITALVCALLPLAADAQDFLSGETRCDPCAAPFLPEQVARELSRSVEFHGPLASRPADALERDRAAYEQAILRALERDSDHCAPLPSEVLRFAERGAAPLGRYTGTTSFYGLLPLRYGYAMGRNREGTLFTSVRICLTNATSLSMERILEFDQHLREATGIWNRRAPERVSYRFERTSDCENADFSIEYVPGPRREAYFQAFAWGEAPEMYAHEIGHMLGIDDYYAATIGDGIAGAGTRCPYLSIMCNAYEDAEITSVEHYLVLRRAYCAHLRRERCP